MSELRSLEPSKERLSVNETDTRLTRDYGEKTRFYYADKLFDENTMTIFRNETVLMKYWKMKPSAQTFLSVATVRNCLHTMLNWERPVATVRSGNRADRAVKPQRLLHWLRLRNHGYRASHRHTLVCGVGSSPHGVTCTNPLGTDSVPEGTNTHMKPQRLLHWPE